MFIFYDKSCNNFIIELIINIFSYSVSCVSGIFLNIEKEERICPICDSNDVADEFHYLFNCTYFIHDRVRFLTKYYYNNPSTYKMLDM